MKFCTKCGTRLETHMAFCTGCGTKTGMQPMQQIGTPPMHQAGIPQAYYGETHYHARKNTNYIIIAIIAAVALVGIILFVNQGNNSSPLARATELEGTWINDVLLGGELERYAETIAFRGNTFRSTAYRGSFPARDGSWGGLGLGGGFGMNATGNSEVISTDLVLHDGRHIYAFVDGVRIRGMLRITHNGTFSISGDILELVFSCGRIETHTFSVTQNTLEIGSIRYLRR